jgi:hypothetical protein
MRRLFQATISFHQTLKDGEQRGERWLNMQVAPEAELWWDPRDPAQSALWGSWIVLGEHFYKAITAAAVPVDMRVLRAIKRSPLALDLYAWVTWRVFKLTAPVFIPWEGLMQQMGGEYERPDNFVQKAKAAMRKIRTCYSALKFKYAQGGIVLEPSPPAVAARLAG